MCLKVNAKKNYAKKTLHVQIKQEIIELVSEHGLTQPTVSTTVHLFMLYLFIIPQCFY
jgi:hypothetical protein